MIIINYDDAAVVTKDIYWVGFYYKEDNSHCNSYLIVDQVCTVLLHLGPILHFPKIMRKVFDLVNPASICAVVVSHQEPDVCGSLASSVYALQYIAQNCIQRLEVIEIDRPPPQNYSIFQAVSVPLAIDYLKQLTCGLDLNNQLYCKIASP